MSFYFHSWVLFGTFNEKNQERCCWLYLGSLSPPPPLSSHGQVSAGLIIPQVEEDVVTKIM